MDMGLFTAWKLNWQLWGQRIWGSPRASHGQLVSCRNFTFFQWTGYCLANWNLCTAILESERGALQVFTNMWRSIFCIGNCRWLPSEARAHWILLWSTHYLHPLPFPVLVDAPTQLRFWHTHIDWPAYREVFSCQRFSTPSTFGSLLFVSHKHVRHVSCHGKGNSIGQFIWLSSGWC